LNDAHEEANTGFDLHGAVASGISSAGLLNYYASVQLGIKPAGDVSAVGPRFGEILD
jgi:hypothetical protein